MIETRSEGRRAPLSSPRLPGWAKKLLASWVTIGAGLLLVTIASASAFAPLLSPFDPVLGNLQQRFQPPSETHLLGTDYLGRDLLSRMLHAGRLSLVIGIGSVLLGLAVGGGAGTIAAYFSGWVEVIIMRIIDVMMTFPYILLAILVVSVLGFSTRNVILAIGVSSIPAFARLARSLVLSIMEQDYVSAARGLGATHRRIIWKHVLPNCVSPLIVYCSLYLGRAILSEAGLSFIGLGIQSPDVSWGVLVAGGRVYLRSYPMLSLAPGLAIMLTVFSLNMLGDAVRDALDPRLMRVG